MTDAEYETRGVETSLRLGAPLKGSTIYWFADLLWVYEQVLIGQLFNSRAAAYQALGKADDLIKRACGYYSQETELLGEIERYDQWQESGPVSTLPPGGRTASRLVWLGSLADGPTDVQLDR
jgi:hypothetical protein